MTKTQRKLWDKAKLYQLLNKKPACCLTCHIMGDGAKEYSRKDGCKLKKGEMIHICLKTENKEWNYKLLPINPDYDFWTFPLCEKYFDKTK